MTGKNYLQYLAEDFATDPYFQKWILEGDHMTNLFWEKWLADNPTKATDIGLAKELVTQLNFRQYEASSEDFNEVWKNIKQTQTCQVNTISSSARKWYIGSVAMIALLISSVILLNNNGEFDENDGHIPHQTITKNTIEAGTDKAILTLADGSDIKLEKGEIYTTKNAKSNGTEIVYDSGISSNEIVYNYLTIPRGGQFFVKLSDGTKVWLNSESRLKYPVNFPKETTRQVELVYGEAYFDVSPSTKHDEVKFKVINQAQEVEVLGTEFNIKAYKDESNLYTTLIEGKVVVNTIGKNTVLAPSQQLNLDLKTNNTAISKVDVYQEISWKNGVFSFKNKSLKDITKVLSRWYEVEVAFNDQTLEKMVFNGTIKKKLSITDVLETITVGNGIEYEINDRTVLLKY